MKQTINQKAVLVNDAIKDYTLYQKNSTFIAYIGVKGDNSLFIQFCNGICFIYPDLPIDLIKSALEAESISVFYHSQIKGKYEGEQLESHCIQPAKEEEEADDEGYEDFFGPHDAAFEDEH